MTECPRCHARLEVDPEAAEYEAAEREAIVAEQPVKPNGAPKVTSGFVVVDQNTPGETVTATWGAESFTPKPYNAFHVGPYSGTTRVLQGETRAQALERLDAELEAYASAAYERKKREYLKRLSGLVRASAES